MKPTFRQETSPDGFIGTDLGAYVSVFVRVDRIEKIPEFVEVDCVPKLIQRRCS